MGDVVGFGVGVAHDALVFGRGFGLGEEWECGEACGCGEEGGLLEELAAGGFGFVGFVIHV